MNTAADGAGRSPRRGQMKKRGITVLFLLGFALWPVLSDAQESSGYLGKKLEYVLENVDNTYVEENRENFATNHRKAFQKLGEHLQKKYPDLQLELGRWIEKYYGPTLKEIKAASEEEHFLVDLLLGIDAQHPDFRRRCISHLRERYPNLFGDIACFLRDNHLATLREVLRATLRMTSHVPSCPIADDEDLENTASQEDSGAEPSGEISMVP